MSGFFDTGNLQPKFDLQCAKQLRDALGARNKLMNNKSSMKAWAAAFGRARRDYGKERIQPVLDWYCQNIGKENIPQAYSGNAFHKNFERIESAMARQGHAEIEITEEAVTISCQLGGLKWPGDEKKDELKFIQANINAYKDYRSKIVALPERLRREGNNELASRVEYLSHKGTYSHNFLVWYIRDVHRYAHSWEGWNGNLMSFVFRPDRPYFDNIARAWLVEFCGTGKDWNTIKEYLK